MAEAVSWDSTSYLHNDALNVGEQTKKLVAFWYKTPIVPDVPPFLSGFDVVDPTGAYASYSEVDYPAGANPANSGIQFSEGDASGSFLCSANSLGTLVPSQDVWHLYLRSVDVTSGPPYVVQAYLDDTPTGGVDDGTGSFGTPPLAGDGVPYWVGSVNEPGGPYDMANYLVWYGVAPDISIEAERRNFIDANGKPVDPAVAVAAYGTPSIMLTGDATAFQTNQGDAGAFTLSGSLTDATTSPSD